MVIYNGYLTSGPILKAPIELIHIPAGSSPEQCWQIHYGCSKFWQAHILLYTEG